MLSPTRKAKMGTSRFAGRFKRLIKREGRMPKDSRKISRIRYYPDPDFSKPLLKIGVEARKQMLGRLSFLYGEAEAKRWMPELERILKVHYAHKPLEMIESEKNFDPRERFTEKDMILIT